MPIDVNTDREPMSFLSESEEEYRMSDDSEGESDNDNDTESPEEGGRPTTDHSDRRFWAECNRLVAEQNRLQKKKHDLEQRETRLTVSLFYLQTTYESSFQSNRSFLPRQ